MNITLYCDVVYAYICSMVKGCMVAIHHHKIRAIYARAHTARGYGAGARQRAHTAHYRTASGSILTFKKKKGKEKPNLQSLKS